MNSDPFSLLEEEEEEEEHEEKPGKPGNPGNPGKPGNPDECLDDRMEELMAHNRYKQQFASKQMDPFDLFISSSSFSSGPLTPGVSSSGFNNGLASGLNSGMNSSLNSGMNSSVNSGMNSAVELLVSNLDQAIDQRDMKKMLLSLFRQHVSVLSVSVFFQSDGNMAASVRVPSLIDAQYSISKLHRTKLGYKRILISYGNNNAQNPAMLRSKVFRLLSEVPGGRIQLFKFREMFEKRYQSSIGVSDLYKMRDVVNIIDDDTTGRMVELIQSPQFHQSLLQSTMSLDSLDLNRHSHSPLSPHALEFAAPFCALHAPKKEEKQGWAEKENGVQLPMVNVSLQVLGPNMKQVVKSHGGSVPLSTISHCYEAEFAPLSVDMEEGVPLEHLISCIKGIEIRQAGTGTKSVIATAIGEDEILNNSNSSSTLSLPSVVSGSSGGGTFSPMNPQGMNMYSSGAPLAGQLAFFSRELVELLKSQPGCRMPFHKFIPSYHHHFGRQCRVADYGYTKLKELFEAIPHVIQIMGEGSRAMITLAHRAQVKRFTSDLLRVLKMQPNKQVGILDLPMAFQKITNRPFRISEYGVCDVEDLLLEISETSVVLAGSGDDLSVSIPKREQTLDEVERTQQFAAECVELLKHAPDCRLPFNKFIPSYHHHFGRQCRVSDYGFTKLIELFEAVPGTIEVTEDADGERLLQLTDSERVKVVGDHIASLIKSSRAQAIPMDTIEEMYSRQYGYQLRPENFGQNTVKGLIKSLSHLLRLDGEGMDSRVVLIDRSYIKELSGQVREILVKEQDGKMEVDNFVKEFENRYNSKVDVSKLQKDLPDMIQILEETDGKQEENNNLGQQEDQTPEQQEEPEENKSKEKKKTIIRLVPLQLCAIRIENLIKDFDGKLYCSELEAAFAEKYKTALCPGQFGFHGINTLIQSGLSKFFSIRGRGTRKMICPVDSSSATPPPLPLSALPSGLNSSSFGTSGMMRGPMGGHYSHHPSTHVAFDRFGNAVHSGVGRNYSSYNPYSSSSSSGLRSSSSSSSSGAPIRFSTLRHEGIRFPQAYHHRQQQMHHWNSRSNYHHPISSSSHRGHHSSWHQNYNSSGGRHFDEERTFGYQGFNSNRGAGGGSGGGAYGYSNSHYNGYQTSAPPPSPTSSRYLNDLAQFGIFPPYSNRESESSAKGLRISNPSRAPSTSSKLSVSPALGSPISAPCNNNTPKIDPFGSLVSSPLSSPLQSID